MSRTRTVRFSMKGRIVLWQENLLCVRHLFRLHDNIKPRYGKVLICYYGFINRYEYCIIYEIRSTFTKQVSGTRT